MFRILILLQLIIMKKLQNLVGAKTLSKKEQQLVKGGNMQLASKACPCSGTYEECLKLCGE